MPRIVRAMRRDGEYPRVGASKGELGAMIGPGHGNDLSMNAAGLVLPKTGGMSVSPTWRDLPAHRIPRRLQTLCSKAAGKNEMHCWQFGEGAFIAGPVSEMLFLRPDQLAHGVVEPDHEMPAQEYQAALAATRERWSLVAETVETNEVQA